MEALKSVAAQAYTQNKQTLASSAQPQGVEGGISEALGSFSDILAKGEATAQAAMQDGADPHALVEALASSQLAVETVVTIRDRVVEAYQEILRMPV